MNRASPVLATPFAASALLALVACTTAPSSAPPEGGRATSSGTASSGGTGSGSTSGGTASGGTSVATPTTCTPVAAVGEVYALSANDLGGDPVSMCNFRGKVMLIFNGASQCGYTPQYKPLETLYQTYKGRGFEALGFPCNQFGGQEPGSSKEISTFCTTEYHITFSMFEKIDVNGASAHPIYQWLKAQAGGAGDITWNFEKFVIGRTGKLVKRFPPSTEPDDPELMATIEAELAK